MIIDHGIFLFNFDKLRVPSQKYILRVLRSTYKIYKLS